MVVSPIETCLEAVETVVITYIHNASEQSGSDLYSNISLALFARKSSIPHFSGKNVNLKLTSDQVLALLNCTGPVYTATLLTSIS